jgi:DNA-binding GntR family transcriptional regulator
MKKHLSQGLQLAHAVHAAERKKSPHRLTIEHPPSLVAVIEERLRRAIINGELKFGQSLSDSGLALGVSRTPMREALTRLEVQGLVHVVPKRGTFVFKPTVTDAHQLATFRLVLETSALEQSLLNDKEGALRDLSAAVDEMRVAQRRQDTLAYSLADSRFHEAFFKHCGNVYLINAFKNVSGRIAALRSHLTVPRPEEQIRSLPEHEAILAAFGAGARKEIRKTLSDHILRSKDAYAQAILENAQPPATPVS